jgi:hypothetical protein
MEKRRRKQQKRTIKNKWEYRRDISATYIHAFSLCQCLSLYHLPFYSTLVTEFSHILTYSHTSSVVFVFIPSLPFCPSLFPISLFLSIPLSHFHLPSYSTLPTTLHLLTSHTHTLTNILTCLCLSQRT